MRATRSKGERLTSLGGGLLAATISVLSITRTDSAAVQAAALLVALVLVVVIHVIGVYIFKEKDQWPGRSPKPVVLSPP